MFHNIFWNLTFRPAAKFVRRYGDAAAEIARADQAFRADVVSRQYPADSESFTSRRKPGRLLKLCWRENAASAFEGRWRSNNDVSR